jgi:hypothetical protein|tara:strand:+ start:159 stop:779 length:621 start_codon:yes stop_codon:yes gene_type:complete
VVVDYNTDRLIVLNFPRNGGGKFISLCLALDKNMLHQDRRAAVRKMNGKSTKQEAFEFSCSVIDQNSDVHKELGCWPFAGFDASVSPGDQTAKANDLWSAVSRQHWYFFMVKHPQDYNFDHYPNAHHIAFKNYEWILKDRNSMDSQQTKHTGNIEFDQESIRNQSLFKNEILNLYTYFKLDEPDWNNIEHLRNLWLNNYKKGFVHD